MADRITELKNFSQASDSKQVPKIVHVSPPEKKTRFKFRDWRKPLPQPYYGSDIETTEDHLQQFIVGVIAGLNGQNYSSASQTEFAEEYEKRSLNGAVLVWNSPFDLTRIFQFEKIYGKTIHLSTPHGHRLIIKKYGSGRKQVHSKTLNIFDVATWSKIMLGTASLETACKKLKIISEDCSLHPEGWRNDLEKFCRWHAELTLRVFLKLKPLMAEYDGRENLIVSPASIAKYELMRRGIRRPYVAKWIDDLAYEGYRGGYTDCICRTTEVKTVGFDLNAQYPNAALLIDAWNLLNAKSITLHKRTQRHVLKLINSFDPRNHKWDLRYLCRVHIIEGEAFVRVLEGGATNTVLATLKNYTGIFFLPDLVMMARRGCNFRILEAWKIEPIGKQTESTNIWEDMLEKRERFKALPIELYFKLVANALYGVTAERRKYTKGLLGGIYFSPIIAGLITATGRLMLQIVFEAAGYQVFYCDTDSAYVPEEIADLVEGRIKALNNPYLQVKRQKTGIGCFLGTKKYAVFSEDPEDCFYSGHGLPPGSAEKVWKKVQKNFHLLCPDEVEPVREFDDLDLQEGYEEVYSEQFLNEEPTDPRLHEHHEITVSAETAVTADRVVKQGGTVGGFIKERRFIDIKKWGRIDNKREACNGWRKARVIENPEVAELDFRTVYSYKLTQEGFMRKKEAERRWKTLRKYRRK
jgi:hypothetical protein